MGDSRVFTDPTRRKNRLQAGIISKIRLENFMCHSNLEIEFGDWVNFITGQNGSGKSAILTALCVAFGSRARGTQRANTIKDFIKNGCSHALVQVEIKNQGEDAFKPEIYGDIIIVDRRISETTSAIILKNRQGRRIGTKREDLREIVEHFNIDVENPCVIMSQDKSREFLHSGNAKDKFKFFFKATLLQQVDDLLKGIEKQVNDATALVIHLEESLRPILKEIDDLQRKIKSMEVVEEIAQQVQLLRQKLAWSMVYGEERQLEKKHKLIERIKGKIIPKVEAQIDLQNRKVEELNDILAKKKSQIADVLEKTSEVRRMKEDLEQSLSIAVKERFELKGEEERKARQIQQMVRQVKSLEQQIHDLQEQYAKNTQVTMLEKVRTEFSNELGSLWNTCYKAEETEMEERLRELQAEVDEANVNCQRLKEQEDEITQKIVMVENEIVKIAKQIEDAERSHRELSSQIRDLQMNQREKVTAFGGGRVMNLLQAIERHQHKFSSPPIGPIGAHVKLEYGDMWSLAIETAVGRVLNAFIVTDHQDSRTLRACAKEANYNHLQIIIYDFSRPRIDIPRHMLPQTNHPTVFSVLRSDNPTVLNVLVDVANAERQVLAKDYDAGRLVAFDQRISNLKEVYTSDGFKMFSRGSAETILPPSRKIRAGRLCGSYDHEIKKRERDAFEAKENAQHSRGVKRAKEEELRDFQEKLSSVKRRRLNVERVIRPKVFELEDVKKLISSESSPAPASTVDELHQEISKLQEVIREKETLLDKIQSRVNEATTKYEDLKVSFEKLCESGKSEVDALTEAETELMMIEKDLHAEQGEKKRLENWMQNTILPDLKKEEAEYQNLEDKCKEIRRKTSAACPESEVEALGGCKESNSEQLNAQLNLLEQRRQRESQRYPESIDDLRMMCEKKQRKISRKQQTYKAFREKLEACQQALHLRWIKFQRNATLLKRQLTWQFNGHLAKKGISGHIKVSFEDQTLSIEVKMPQDASSSSVRDTRGLSGGERSFSTLCFALALHEMTEAPFRAMDEFDVFMDAVSRKISLDAIVDFALAHGSQWIFITPHDISMVKNDDKIKKQQMAAPRG
ncbi:structural maintenance of chromosomes protein 6b [Phtheirospermum japonicum]|uniref:Structural maintenance of chromosomes protein 6b n=1 Tax=Phtheirospermum japonicum TaxID=374723 RepID=A0A830CVW4_9LAMI|nr:structural maintenance of chromosomes protein 6b [Phtheirospermum japonicum]